MDNVSYPPTRNGRAPFVPIGVNGCPALVMAAGDSPQRIDWCYDSGGDLNASAVDTGTNRHGPCSHSDATQYILYVAS
jgi:hypothetical protein